MVTQAFYLHDFNRYNLKNQYFIQLKDTQYVFKCSWNAYGDCGFLDIEDINRNKIISGIALVNGLTIRHNKIPYILYFRHINNETYEPTIENISKEFAFFYQFEDET